MATVHKEEIQTFAEEYFSSHNYLNKKILQDVSQARSNFEENIWAGMSVSERDEVRLLLCTIE